MRRDVEMVGQAALGGLNGGAFFGLAEGLLQLALTGAPDLLAPLYGYVLYGLIGIPMGLAGGVVLVALDRSTGSEARRPALGHVVGVVAAVAPIALFVLRYLANKWVYAEQGVPLLALAGILLLVALGSGFEIFVMGAVARTRGRWVLHPGKLLGSMLAIGLPLVLLAVAPWGADPRASWAHGKPMIAALQDKPNVLFIAVDTLRADQLGSYGNPSGDTPVMDGLAADGVVFEAASAHASWTRSSFASLWSSRLPSGHNADRKASRLADELVLLPEVLSSNGVTTGSLVNNINVTSTFNFDQGWDSFLYEAPDYHFGASESVFSLTLYKVVHKLREKLGGSMVVHSFYQPADVVLADARAFIEANRDARWMLSVHLMEPHDPYFAHPYLDGTSTDRFNGVAVARATLERPDLAVADELRALYAGEIAHMDRELAPFIDWLRAEGMYADTLIVLTSDHGEEFGEHGGFWHGTSLYEEQLAVPLILKLPGGELAGTRAPFQVGLVDVAPTVTAVMGMDRPPQWVGRELVALVRQAREAERAESETLAIARARVDALSEAEDAGTLADTDLSALEDARALLLAAETQDPCAAYTHFLDRPVIAEQDFEGNVLSSVETLGFKLLTANEGNPRGLPTRELFDLVADPRESVNLAELASPICGQTGVQRTAGMGVLLAGALDGARVDAVAPDADEVELDDGERCRLCALGYLSGAECEAC